jgi:outer membrane protein TolC
VADAQTALFNQKNAHIQALYDYQAALAALRKATGDR